MYFTMFLNRDDDDDEGFHSLSMHRIQSGGVDFLGGIISVSTRVFHEIMLKTDLSTNLERPCMLYIQSAIYILKRFSPVCIHFFVLAWFLHSTAKLIQNGCLLINRLLKNHQKKETV